MANANAHVFKLIDNGAATGPNTMIGPGGLYAFSVVGTFSGATVKLQILLGDGSTFVDVATASLTAAGYVNVSLPPRAVVKAVVTGGPPSGIYAQLKLID